MWLRLSVHGCNFGYVPEILAKYRKHTRNISSYHSKAALSHIIALRKLKSRIRESPTTGNRESLRLIDDRIGREKAILIIGLLGEGRTIEAKELARELFLTKPHVFRNLFVFLECYFPFLSGIRRTAISVKKMG